MPYTKQNLQTLNNLSEDEVNQTLSAAALECGKQSYTDEEIQSSFDIIRSYFNSGQVSDYGAAAELFKQHQLDQHSEVEVQAKTKKQTKGKKLEDVNANVIEQSDHLNVLELIALASKKCQTRITLSEAVQILDICGLCDQEQYTSFEGDHFLEACDLLKKQNKSSKEVAAHLGVNSGLPDTSMQQVESVVETMTTNADALTDELLQQSAEAKALTDAQKYMVYYAKAAAEGQQVQEFWARLREHAQSKLTGKSQARLIRAEPQPTFILQSSPNSSDSSPTSENGTTNE